MDIAIIGAGYVGLTHAAVCAESGHRVVAYDIDTERIVAYATGRRAAIERYVNEPGLAECIAAELGRNLFFTTKISDIAGAQVIFLCLPTPPQRNGATDRSLYTAGAMQVADVLAARPAGAERVLLVNKSTVPIGTARLLESILLERGARNVGVASNPEFLPQGSALHSSRSPDRVVLGTRTVEDRQLLRRVYARFPGHERTPVVETNPETSEAIKYVVNALLMTYISFWNGVAARLAEEYSDVDMDALRLGVLGDARISAWGSYVGNGAGGSCFGKDILSLIHQLDSKSCSTTLLRAVYEVNEYQKVYLIDRAVRDAGFCFNNKTVALLGLAFKRNTNDMRDSAALPAIQSLLARGVTGIRAHDPLVDEVTARGWLDPACNHLFERVSYHGSVEEAIAGSDALFIATDWEEYREVARVLRGLVTPPYLVIDGRRMVGDIRHELVAEGYEYLAVGSAFCRIERVCDAVKRTARNQAA